MPDKNLIEILLKSLVKDKNASSNEEALLKHIETISEEIQNLTYSIDTLTNILKQHNEAIENLYSYQDIIMKMLNLDTSLEEQDLSQSQNQKNKKILN